MVDILEVFFFRIYDVKELCVVIVMFFFSDMVSACIP